MDTVFDRLAREISRDERRHMLEQIDRTRHVPEEPLRLDDLSDGGTVVLDREFSMLPFFAKLRIVIVGFFSGKGRQKLTEEYLLRRLFRQVDRSAPGLLDFPRQLIAPELHRELTKLKAALDVFRGPLNVALDGDKESFYALLGKVEFEDIQERLETELNPDELEKQFPGEPPAEVKKRLDKTFDSILDDIVPDRRRRMLNHTKTLYRLRTLTRYPFERALQFFPATPDGSVAPASITELGDPLLELGDALHAFRDPPSTKLLEALYLFDAQDRIDDGKTDLEAEILDRMDRSHAALEIIRKFNAEIPWRPLLKILAGDIRYVPRTVGGGEDWFRIYRQFWKKRETLLYQEWADRRRQRELGVELRSIWGIEEIPPLPGYGKSDFSDRVKPRHGGSFAAIRTFYLEVFPGRLYHALNLVMIDGKFYKKDNRREYDDVFGRFLKTPDKIRAFEAKLRPDGDYGSRAVAARREIAEGPLRDTLIADVVSDIDRDCQLILMPCLQDMRALGKLLGGILNGDGGTYDTLSNLSDIGGQGHATFRATLRSAEAIIVKSAEIISDSFDLEERLEVS